MDKDQLEDVAEVVAMNQEIAEVAAAAPATENVLGPATSRGFPQLFKFRWGGIMIAIGALLPFGSAVVTDMFSEFIAATPEKGGLTPEELARTLSVDMPEPAAAVVTAAPTMPSAPGFETFTGAIFLLIGLLLVAQMQTAIAERKVKLTGVFLAFFPAGWCWMKLITVTGDLEWFSWSDMYLLTMWNRLALDIGAGFLVVLFGSTYVVYTFIKALFGAASGGKKEPVPVPAARAGGGARGRRR